MLHRLLDKEKMQLEICPIHQQQPPTNRHACGHATRARSALNTTFRPNQPNWKLRQYFKIPFITGS